MTKVSQLIADLNLRPHPEGGWYRQTWKAAAADGHRPTGTAIYYLLDADQTSRWHHVDATEIWHFYTGAPLRLSLSKRDTGPVTDTILGPDIAGGHCLQVVVPPGHWQSARTTGAYSLVGCTVSPGFRFEGFHLAPLEFDIPR